MNFHLDKSQHCLEHGRIIWFNYIQNIFSQYCECNNIPLYNIIILDNIFFFIIFLEWTSDGLIQYIKINMTRWNLSHSARRVVQRELLENGCGLSVVSETCLGVHVFVLFNFNNRYYYLLKYWSRVTDRRKLVNTVGFQFTVSLFLVWYCLNMSINNIVTMTDLFFFSTSPRTKGSCLATEV